MFGKQLNFLHIFSENDDTKKIEAENNDLETDEIFDPYEENIKIEGEIEAANQESVKRLREALDQMMANSKKNDISGPVSFAGLNIDEMAMKEGFSGNAGRVKRGHNSRPSTGTKSKHRTKSKRRLTKWSKTDKRFGKDAAAGEALDL